MSSMDVKYTDFNNKNKITLKITDCDKHLNILNKMQRRIYSRLNYKTFSICRSMLFIFFISYAIFKLCLYIKYLSQAVAPFPQSFLELKYTIVHFDLKGAPPNMKYFQGMLRHLKSLEVNAILVEYEDMFPYEGDLRNLSTPFHYSKAQLLDFLERASNLDIEVIPLIQTFGHLEYALKLEEFQDLREDPVHPDSLCPSRERSLDLLRDMIRQVIQLHNYITPLKFIHIGCDEVYQLNTCDDCKNRNLDNVTLYLQHLEAVSKIVQSNEPHITILFWDDMLRHTKITTNFHDQVLKLGRKYPIQPVYWEYAPDLNISHPHMHLYQKSFKNIWAASAFKGADGMDAVTPNINDRLLNNLNWLRFIETYKKLYNFNGIILTGWSRYSHFLPICELLPISHKSLLSNLLLIDSFKYGLTHYDRKDKYTIKEAEIAKKLYFNRIFLRLEQCLEYKEIGFRSECSLYNEKIFNMEKIAANLTELIEKHRNLLLDYDIEAKITFGYIDSHSFPEFILNSLDLYKEISLKSKLLKRYMRHYFDENVYNEYISYKIYTTKKEQRKLYGLVRQGRPGIVWNRRGHFNV